MTSDRLDMFVQRYDAQDTPWDTGITPPEIVSIIQELAPGQALDLGCGTGTNLRYLLEHGWQADGVDFVPQAVEQARAKLADFPASMFAVYCHDVTKLRDIPDLRVPYDLVVDIGCGHGVPADQAVQYAHEVASLMRPGGIWMLYAHQPSAERDFGWTSEDVQRISSADFELTWQVLSEDTTNGFPSGWYRLTKSG
ncbi:MAG: methyltransferase domain-containing protein [Anaerolineae bacterium]|nr:methyltransferase domain-containing protein [Anaerolineae bacterium]